MKVQTFTQGHDAHLDQEPEVLQLKNRHLDIVMMHTWVTENINNLVSIEVSFRWLNHRPEKQHRAEKSTQSW